MTNKTQATAIWASNSLLKKEQANFNHPIQEPSWSRIRVGVFEDILGFEGGLGKVHGDAIQCNLIHHLFNESLLRVPFAFHRWSIDEMQDCWNLDWIIQIDLCLDSCDCLLNPYFEKLWTFCRWHHFRSWRYPDKTIGAGILSIKVSESTKNGGVRCGALY